MPYDIRTGLLSFNWIYHGSQKCFIHLPVIWGWCNGAGPVLWPCSVWIPSSSAWALYINLTGHFICTCVTPVHVKTGTFYRNRYCIKQNTTSYGGNIGALELCPICSLRKFCKCRTSKDKYQCHVILRNWKMIKLVLHRHVNSICAKLACKWDLHGCMNYYRNITGISASWRGA